MMLEELHSLCADRELATAEQHSPNDFYGNARVLKSYCGLPAEYSLKASFEHAPTLGDQVWQPDLDSPFPTMLTFARSRFPIMRRDSRKALFALGSPIQYAAPLLTSEQTARERQRLGRSLLVFPSHSSHHLAVQYDVKGYIAQIHAAAKAGRFDTVRICMYWKDVLNGTAQIYNDQGFEIVSAGHMFDPQFLNRLRSLIELASVCTGAEGGTTVGYCIALNRPFFFTMTDYGYTMKDAAAVEAMRGEIARAQAFYQQVESAFGRTPHDLISPSQRQLIDARWGLSSMRSVEELRVILEICEDLFSLSKQRSISNYNYLFELLPNYIRAGQDLKVRLILDELEASDPLQRHDIALVRSYWLVQVGKKTEARVILQDYLMSFPQHEGAKQLLSLCS